MMTWLLKGILVIILAVSFAWAAPPGADVDTLALKRAIKQAQKKSKEVSAKIREESSRYQAYLQRTQKRINDRRKQLQQVAAQKDSLDALIRERRSARDHQERKAREFEHRFSRFLEMIRSQTNAMRSMVQTGFPFEKDKRLSPMDLLIQDIDRKDVSPEEAFHRFWTLCDAEQRMGTDCEIASVEITLPQGQTIPVKMLRVGKQFLAYRSLENEKYGLLQIRPSASGDASSYAWRHGDLTFEERRAIKLAVEVKEGKRPPQLVPLPYSFQWDKVEGGSR